MDLSTHINPYAQRSSALPMRHSSAAQAFSTRYHSGMPYQAKATFSGIKLPKVKGLKDAFNKFIQFFKKAFNKIVNSFKLLKDPNNRRLGLGLALQYVLPVLFTISIIGTGPFGIIATGLSAWAGGTMMGKMDE